MPFAPSAMRALFFLFFTLCLSTAFPQVHLAVIAREDQVLSLGICAGVEAASSEWALVAASPVVHKLVGVRSPGSLASGVASVMSTDTLGVIIWGAGWDEPELTGIADKLRLAGVPYVIFDFRTEISPAHILLGEPPAGLLPDAVAVNVKADLHRVQGIDLTVLGDHPWLIPLMETGTVTTVVTTPAEDWGYFVATQLLMKLDPVNGSIFELPVEPPATEIFTKSDLVKFKQRWTRWLAQ